MSKNMLRISILETKVKTCAQPSIVLAIGERKKEMSAKDSH